MRVIIEGPDGAGKTTLLNWLAGLNQATHSEHLDRPGPSETEESWHRYFRIVLSRATEHDHVIVSRCHISEPIYGTMLRDGGLIPPWRYTQLNMLLMRLGYVVVFCTANVKDLEQRIRGRADAMSDYDRAMLPRLRELVHRYMDAYYAYPGPKLLYDSSIDTPETFGRPMLLDRGVPRKLSGIGEPTSGRVLVGDRFSGHYVGRVPPPASPKWNQLPPGALTPFDHGGSSRYLMERLANLQLTNKVYVLNSHYDRTGEVGSRQLLKEELATLEQSNERPDKTFRVVALGEAAAKRLAGLVPEVHKITHPQAWRRFNHHDKHGYAKMLKEAVHA